MRASTFVLFAALLGLLAATSVDAQTEYGTFYLTVTDTYLRAEWSVSEDGSKVSYYDITITNRDTKLFTTKEKNVSTFYPVGDDVTYDNLQSNTDYNIKVVAYLTNGKTLTYDEDFTTAASYVCDEETIAAFFSSEVYGPVPYPSYTFCGRTWTTYYSTPANKLSESHREFIVYNQALGIAVVAFRGTVRTLADWVVNLELDQESCEDFVFDGKCDGLINDGFGDEYLRSRADLRSYLTDIVRTGYKRIIVTGHSQGAALATIGAIDLKAFVEDQTDITFEIRSITLGSPRVGDDDFADDWNERFGSDDAEDDQSNLTSIRFVGETSDAETQDPITQVPIDVPFVAEFQHVNTEVPVVYLSDDVCEINTDFNIPCHSILAYLESVASSSTDHFAAWTLESAATTADLRAAVVAPALSSTRATINAEQSPNTISGSPVTLSNTPVSLSGSPVTLSNTPVSLSGSPVTLSNTPVSLSGSPVTLSNTPVSLSGSPLTLSATPVSLSGSPLTPLSVSNVSPVSVSNVTPLSFSGTPISPNSPTPGSSGSSSVFGAPTLLLSIALLFALIF